MLFDYISQKGCMGQKPQQQNNTTSTATQHGLEKDYGSKVEKHNKHSIMLTQHGLEQHNKHITSSIITKMIPLQTQVVHLKDDSIT